MKFLLLAHKSLLSWAVLLLIVASVQSSNALRPPAAAASAILHRQCRLLQNEDCFSYDFFYWPFYDKSKLMGLRGGAENEEEDGDDVDEDDGDESEQENDGEEVQGQLDFSAVIEKAGSITQSIIIPYSKKTLVVLMKVTKKIAVSTSKAIQRAVQAALQGDEEAEEQDEGRDPVPMIQKILETLHRMVKAALTFPEEDSEETLAENGDEDDETGDSDDQGESDAASKKKTTLKAKKLSDFGTFLASAYGMKDERTAESGAPVIGGSLSTALLEARAQARLLVIFLPAEKPGKKAADSKEAIVIDSMLSREVGDAANQSARSTGGDTGSFLFWSAKVGSSEAAAAMKRLKIKTRASKDGKRPTLMVVYAAMVVDPSTGQSKVVPKVLAQHHCNPPPSSSVMASWLNTLRKRHGKQYTAMQTVLKELQYFKERKEGYTESKKSDKEKKKREKEEEEKRLAAEKAELERLKETERRREELKSALPEEAKGKDAKKVALRFADGRSGQRRFNPDQPMMDVFNWVDAMYGIEREKVILTTMNGKLTFEWEENKDTLEDAGLGKNTGFRVSIKETNESKNDEPTDSDP